MHGRPANLLKASCPPSASLLYFTYEKEQIRRAGLDYWDSVDLTTYPNLETFFEQNPTGEKYYFSTAGKQSYSDVSYAPGDYLIFGNETHGLPDDLLAKHPEHVCNIPIKLDCVRSINLSNCAAIVLYEALRQLDS